MNTTLWAFVLGAVVGWVARTRFSSKGSIGEDFKTWKEDNRVLESKDFKK